MKINYPGFPNSFGFITANGSMMICQSENFISIPGPNGKYQVPLGWTFSAVYTDEARKKQRGLQLTPLATHQALLEAHHDGVNVWVVIDPADPRVVEMRAGLQQVQGVTIED